MAQQAHRPREQWATRAGFILAAIGSAIGLGNIWRFPAVTYENGGGAFLLPYLVALVTAGIPLLILEYTIGRRYRASPPAAFHQLARPAEALGWWQVAICFVIATYYAVILAWAVRYVGFSAGQDWGDDPETFLFADFLELADEPGDVSAFVPGVAVPLIAVWIVVLAILAMGVRRGIEQANKIFIPLLVIFFTILVIRALTLDGAADGLDALFSPDWGELNNGSVWVAAYGQIFFSLSIGFGIMITYASYLRRRSDLTGSALVAGFANSSFEILAGIGVFATLGFMAAQAGVGVDEVSGSGLGLAFVAFPQVISEMPAGWLFGLLFFGSLVVAGLSSLISIVQVIVSAVQDRTGLGRTRSVLLVGGVTGVVSVLLFSTDGGLYFLDAADHFINQYGIALAALAVVITVSWLLRRLPALQADADATSAVRLGMWWRICLGIITPLVLGWMMIDSLVNEFDENYEGYPTSFLVYSGWAVAAGAILLGVLLTLIPWRRRPAAGAEAAPVPGAPSTPDEGKRP
ncbi:sodium-dependent transporter [Streptomyces aidingensis]|uniref:Neurotransmitter:Na+ symporter, NSS family n=1 Tax=Streptomyces aidingensis TaxID=910347 RepID=A0A1I1FM19_9ACTN|nr:sodium-dependent transporter [Streptomyces aidingensis]SFC00467.1 neurotransmitter:Na+ symporter, NSS family [Streptomyces aidingensis]